VSVRAQEKQHMQARLLVKQKRAQALEGEVERLTQATKNQTEAYTQLQADVESQHAEIEIQRKAIEAQSGEMGQKIQDEVQRQVSMIFTNIASGNSFINFQSSAPILMLR
jgi:chromosome segregation ATPase